MNLTKLHILTTDPDRDITEDTQRITKIRDTTLVSCASQKHPSLFERGVIAMCVFVWVNSKRLNCADARSWKKSKDIYNS